MEIDSVKNYVGKAQQAAQNVSKNAAEILAAKYAESAQNIQAEKAVKTPGASSQAHVGDGSSVPEKEAGISFVKTAVDNANAKLKDSSRMLICKVHEKTHRISVKVVNTRTEEVIREIPPEKTLDMFAKMLELAGLLYDEKK